MPARVTEHMIDIKGSGHAHRGSGHHPYTTRDDEGGVVGVVSFDEPAMLRRQKLIVQGEVTAVLSALRGGGGGGGGRWIGIGRSNSVNQIISRVILLLIIRRRYKIH